MENDNNVIDVTEYVESVEPTKWDKCKTWMGRKYVQTKAFVKEHGREIVTVGIPTAIVVTKAIVKACSKTQYEKERDRIDHTYYDPATGAHWELKRKLTNKERQELINRKDDGEDVYDILQDMKVGKK